MSLPSAIESAAVRLTVLLVLLTIGNPGPSRAITGQGGDAPPDMSELVRLYRTRDYFTLREHLRELPNGGAPQMQVLRAGTAHAFNELERSDELLEAVLAKASPLSDSLRYEARLIHARNLLRRYRYAEAAAVYEELASAPPRFVDSADAADHRNMARAARALEDVPPQEVVARSATVLPEVGRTHVEVTIGDSVRDYAIDTGADFSVLIRSEAEALGLEIRDAGVELGSSTERTVTADLAVAEGVRLGSIDLRNVVFLVLPDEAMTFPGIVVRGLIGFPVVEALGEMTFRSDGSIEIPATVPRHQVQNLALHDLAPYVQVGYGDDELLCVLDTGNLQTHFYEPFFRRYRSQIEEKAVADTFRTGGAGGFSELPGYRLRKVSLQVGGRRVSLEEAAVYTKPIRRESSNVVDCNLARDALSSHGSYTLNFRSMSLVLD